MFFAKFFATALASAATVSALVTPVVSDKGSAHVARTGGDHGPPPAGCTPSQWEAIWLDCESKEQNGLINVSVDVCVAAEVQALLAGILHLKRTGHGPPPTGVTPSQWESIWLDCESKEQNGLINVAVDVCVAAEVEALLAGILHLKRTDHGTPPTGVTPSQWEAIWLDCETKKQNGLINVAVDVCVAAEVEALLAGILHLKRTGHGTPPTGVTPSQWEAIWLDCETKEQNGLINVAVDVCVAAEVEALLAGILHLKRTGHGTPPTGVTPSQWESIWLDCENKEQNGLINVAVDVCVAAEVQALLAGILHLKRTSPYPCPSGCTPAQCEAIWVKCGGTTQNGLINIEVSVCVIAELEALLGIH